MNRLKCVQLTLLSVLSPNLHHNVGLPHFLPQILFTRTCQPSVLSLPQPQVVAWSTRVSVGQGPSFSELHPSCGEAAAWDGTICVLPVLGPPCESAGRGSLVWPQEPWHATH